MRISVQLIDIDLNLAWYMNLVLSNYAIIIIIIKTNALQLSLDGRFTEWFWMI
jgi:hypothetical protein